MEKKKFKLGLVPKLIIAIIIGILFGQFLPTGFWNMAKYRARKEEKKKQESE